MGFAGWGCRGDGVDEGVEGCDGEEVGEVGEEDAGECVFYD